MSETTEVQAQSSISQLLRAIGGWGGPGGPGLFMFRSLIVGSSTSAILGLSLASLTATFSGPAALAFAIGSSVGFIGGTIHYYHLSLRSAGKALDQFPALMRLHLRANYPLVPWEHVNVGREGLVGVGASWGMQSMAVAAWESAGPALQELHNRKEAEILSELAARGSKES